MTFRAPLKFEAHAARPYHHKEGMLPFPGALPLYA